MTTATEQTAPATVRDGVAIEPGEFKGHKTLKLSDSNARPDRPVSICFGVAKAKLILKALPEIQALANSK